MLVYILLFGGVFFFALTTLGLLRFPDAYSRLHAASLGDTLGFALIIIALLILVPDWVNRFKLLMVLGVVWVINPTTSHYVGKVALLRGNWVVVRRRHSLTEEQEGENS
ncbi:MAG: monovalent cation/H(+) antiporter subunit G [Bacillota bacterium]|nr:monovalent cation/H(+) antiporter subunit G [Bacillota bacterium]HHU61061.1 monovalent cation/H(+) antiporter subunit G [Natronincola sp.]